MRSFSSREFQSSNAQGCKGHQFNFLISIKCQWLEVQPNLSFRPITIPWSPLILPRTKRLPKTFSSKICRLRERRMRSPKHPQSWKLRTAPDRHTSLQFSPLSGTSLRRTRSDVKQRKITRADSQIGCGSLRQTFIKICLSVLNDFFGSGNILRHRSGASLHW